MPNWSLFAQLHVQHPEECLLDWNKRMNIAIGLSKGIAYLHHQATPRVIHRGIKASNVLLDADFQARISGFGFANLIGATQVSTKIKEIVGNLKMEYALFGKALESWDVFGILLLELASGKRPIEKSSAISIFEWALPLACEKKFSELADLKLKGKFVEEELRRVILVGLVRAQSQPEKRATMLEVAELLKEESKDKLSELDENELFKNHPASENKNGASVADNSSDFVAEEKEIFEIKENNGLGPTEPNLLTHYPPVSFKTPT